MSTTLTRALPGVILGCLSFIFPACGQKEKFDIFDFIPPAGFTRTEGTYHLDFIKFNETKTDYVEFTLYKSRPGTSDVKAEFIKEWNEIVKKNSMTDAPAPTEEKSKDEDEWLTAFGTAPIQFSGGNYSQTLITVAGYGRVSSICIRVTKGGDMKEVETFLSETKVPPLKSSSTPPITATLTNESGRMYAGSPFVGVWRGVGSSSTVFGVTNAAGTGFSSVFYGSALAVKQIVFLEDGSFTFVLPNTGLHSYATDRAKNPNYWGTFQVIDKDNGKVMAGSQTSPFLLKNGSLIFDGTEFHKQVRSDHQKLEGTFTAEKNPDRWKGQTNLEPTITFSSDGKFSDQGAFYYIRHVRGYTEDSQDNNYGSGTYDISNYTITFSYSDGRKIEMSFLDFGPNEIGISKSMLERK